MSRRSAASLVVMIPAATIASVLVKKEDDADRGDEVAQELWKEAQN